MNKKLLFATLSLAALAACTTDDFESQKVAQEVGNVKFKVVNDKATTRASMNGNTIVWNANDGDLFTLYNGAAAQGDTKGYENACYAATADEGGAILSTPTMIKEGAAIMVWPVDTTFRIDNNTDLSLVIPALQENIENNIPYVSDQIQIAAYDPLGDGSQIGWKNTAGKDREYPVYMRPMASQLTVKAEYGDTENDLKKLYKGGADGLSDEDAIEPITVTDVSLLTDPLGATRFSTELPVTFTGATPAQTANWNAKEPHNAWTHVTGVDRTNPIAKADKLTSKCLIGNESSKFLILPQADIAGGVAKGAVEVNTYYGRVLIAKKGEYPESKYTDDEYNNAWSRYVTTRVDPATTIENASATVSDKTNSKGEPMYRTVAKSVALGMQQTINTFSNYVAPAGSTVEGEYMGVATTRYLNVNLKHLDMSNLHIKSDKQLRDVARVWKKLGLDAVSVYLDGDANDEFIMSQKTVKLLNELNKNLDGTYKSPLPFTVKPCVIAPDEDCKTIVITGGGDVEDMAFIVNNGGTKAKLAFNEDETWKWKGTVKVGAADIYRIYNRGTMVNDAAGESTLKTAEANGTQNNVRLVNLGTWNITAGTLFVQFDVTNQKDMEISKGAEFRQDGTGHNFYNWSNELPTRFGGDDKVNGLITNKGVFATVNGGKIYNYALIEHKDNDAKTYISSNQVGGNFGAAFASGANVMGRINLPYSNKNEDNVSITSALDQGFVSVTVDGEVSGALNADVLGSKVNYVIIKSGVTEINKVAGTVKYLEINEPGTEIAWKVSETTSYDGLMVLSNVNITQSTNVTVTKATYLGATMYVGGIFTNAGWSGYYGDTSAAFTTKYVTY